MQNGSTGPRDRGTTGGRRLFAVLAASLVIANPLLHKSISNVADLASARFGFAHYDLAALVAIPIVSLLAAMPLLVRVRRVLHQPATLLCLAALMMMTAAAQHWLLVVNIELIHLPQFALLAALLSRAGLSPLPTFTVTTVAGIFDETYQHLVTYANTPGTYFDINDIVLNALGAVWGVLLLSSPPTDGSRASVMRTVVWSKRHWIGTTAIAVALLALAWWWDPPVFTPLLRPSPAHPFYRVLSTVEGLFICGVLGALVLIASRPAATALGSRHAVLGAQTIVLFLAVVASACAPRSPVQTPQPPPLSPDASSGFVTTFWCGPPLSEFNDQRASEIANAGFSVVGPPCEGPITGEGNRRALDVAAKHGLKMWVADPRFDEHARSRTEWEAALDAAVGEYRDHPALGGYFVTDEPSFDQFDDLRAIVTRLRAADPSHLAYINLNPDYVFRDAADSVYRTYVERFVEAVQPSLLSFDYYPFLVDGDRATFFRSLDLFRDAAYRHQLPFLLILLAMPHGPYRDPSEAELSWQAFHALAYGASGISYFAYWTPVDVAYADVFKFRHGLIEDGHPTVHYVDASRLNREVRALATHLQRARLRDVRDSRGEVAPPLPFGPIADIAGGPVTVGVFEDEQGRAVALLVNRDYRRAVVLNVRSAARKEMNRLDTRTGRWVRTDGRRMDLAAGGAVLLRWTS